MRYFYLLFTLLLSVNSFSQTCPVKSSFTPFGDSVITGAAPLLLTSTSTNATSYFWKMNSTYLSTSSSVNFSVNGQFAGAGVYQIELIAGNGNCSDTSQCTFIVRGTPPTDSTFQLNIGQEFIEVQPKKLVATPDTGYLILADRLRVSNTEGRKAYLIKIGKTGCIMWSKLVFQYYNSPLSINGVLQLKPTTDGGCIVLGNSSDCTTGNCVLFSWLIKFDKNGNFEWQKNISAENIYGALIDFEGTGDGYVLGGTLDKYVHLVKLDLNGNVVWNRAFSWGDYHQLTGLVHINGKLYCLGYARDNASAYFSFSIKLNASDGTLIWKTKHQGSDILFTGVNVLDDKMAISMKASDGLRCGIMDTTGAFSNMLQVNLNKPVNTQEYEVHLSKDSQYIISARGTETLPLQPYYQYHSIIAKFTLQGKLVWAREGANYYRDYFTLSTISTDNSVGILGLAYNHLERSELIGHNMTFLKITKNGTMPSCIFSAHQMSAFPSYINKAALPLLIDTSWTYVTSPTVNAVERTYTESLYDCPTYFKGCNELLLQKFDTTCNLAIEHILKYKKGFGCFTPVTWQYNTSDIKILYQNDSIVRFKFLHYGATKLKGTLNASCTVFLDSIILVATDKSIANYSIGPDFGICAGMTKTLSAGAGFVSYLWQDSSTDSIFVVSNPGTYYVAVKDTCGNVYTDTVIATLTTSVPVNAGPDVSKCNGDSIKLNAPSSFSSYAWSPSYNIININTASPTVYPLKDTAYILSVKNAQGCMGFDTIRVKVNISLPVNLGNDTTLCSGSQLILNAGIGYLNYLWSNGSTNALITVTDSAIYSIKAKDVNGCISGDTIRVGLSNTPLFNLGSDTALCEKEHLVLQENIPGSYTWQTGSTEMQQDVATAGLYWLEINDNGCKYRDSINITYKPLPVVALGKDTSICEGASTVLAVNPSYTNIVWQDNTTASAYTVTKPGTYFVKATLSTCAASDTVIISQILKPKFNLGSDTLLCLGQTLLLKVNLPAASYLWSTGSISSSYTITSPGIYRLTVTNLCGTTTDEIQVNIGVCNIEMPTAFSPNNDGLNDQFRVKYPQSIRDIVMKIYNRSGQVIFTSADPYKGWDGAVNGIPQNTANYIYIISYETVSGIKGTLHGNVLLIR